jgi:hypothetical protein
MRKGGVKKYVKKMSRTIWMASCVCVLPYFTFSVLFLKKRASNYVKSYLFRPLQIIGKRESYFLYRFFREGMQSAKLPSSKFVFVAMLEIIFRTYFKVSMFELISSELCLWKLSQTHFELDNFELRYLTGFLPTHTHTHTHKHTHSHIDNNMIMVCSI